MLLLLFNLSCVYCDSLSVMFLGDTHFGENYQYDPKFNHGENIIEEYGYDYFFENVKDILLTSDITFCNLETPLMNIGRNTLPVSYMKPYLHWGTPDSVVKYLKKYNINNVTIGNNHVFDYGQRGYNSTVNALISGKINCFGAGDDSVRASKPLILDTKGNKLIIFGGFEYRQKYDTLYDFYAGVNKPGVNKLDTIRLSSQIKLYRKDNPGAIIIIYPHWGSNYKPANELQKAYAHNFIDAGADVVIGHGAHTIQEVELYNGKWIFYNIGNFIFNSPGRYRSTGAKPFGIMLKLIINSSGNYFVIYPVNTNNKANDYSIRPIKNNEIGDLYEVLFRKKYSISVNRDNSKILR